MFITIFRLFEIKIMTLPIWGGAKEARKDAFTHIAEAYMNDVYNFSRWMLGDPDDAADITSETFLSLYEHLNSVDTTKPMKPWLIKVARNKCLDLIKKKKNIPFSVIEGDNEETFDVPDEDSSIEQMFDSEDFLEKVKNIVSEYPTEIKEVLLLKYFEQFTFAEIAETLGIPENTAKSHFYRAQKGIYKRVKELTHA